LLDLGLSLQAGSHTLWQEQSQQTKQAGEGPSMRNDHSQWLTSLANLCLAPHHLASLANGFACTTNNESLLTGYACWHTNLLRFQGAQPDDVQVES